MRNCTASINGACAADAAHSTELENGAQVAFKLQGQIIEMFPLESRFIECDRLGQVVGDEIDFGSLQNAERFGLDLMKRGVMWDTAHR